MTVKVVRTEHSFIARSFSFFLFKRIYVGQGFYALSHRMQTAVLIHEMAHCNGHHTEWRILALLWPFAIPALCRRQEFEADTKAAERGYAREMVWLLRHDNDGGLFHPKNSLRREKLMHNKFFA